MGSYNKDLCIHKSYDHGSDLGPESVKRLTLKDLPLVVAADCYGQDAFTLGQKAYLEGQNEA